MNKKCGGMHEHYAGGNMMIILFAIQNFDALGHKIKRTDSRCYHTSPRHWAVWNSDAEERNCSVEHESRCELIIRGSKKGQSFHTRRLVGQNCCCCTSTACRISWGTDSASEVIGAPWLGQKRIARCVERHTGSCTREKDSWRGGKNPNQTPGSTKQPAQPEGRLTERRQSEQRANCKSTVTRGKRKLRKNYLCVPLILWRQLVARSVMAGPVFSSLEKRPMQGNFGMTSNNRSHILSQQMWHNFKGKTQAFNCLRFIFNKHHQSNEMICQVFND